MSLRWSRDRRLKETLGIPIRLSAAAHLEFIQRIGALDYYSKNGLPDTYHIYGSIRNLGVEALDDENMAQVEAALHERAQQKQAERIAKVSRVPKAPPLDEHDPPMTEQEFAEYQQLKHYDAASLRAMALWLNTKKTRARLMEETSLDLGRNTRSLARAVDFFRPHFTGEGCLQRTAEEYLMLFEYAKFNRETATGLYAEYGFTKPLYTLKQITGALLDAKRDKKKPARITDKQMLNWLDQFFEGDLRAEIKEQMLSESKGA